MELAKRHFKFKKNRCPRHVKWLSRDAVYEGELISMTSRVVRLYGTGPTEPQPYVDVSYDWLIPVR